MDTIHIQMIAGFIVTCIVIEIIYLIEIKELKREVEKLRTILTNIQVKK